MTELEPRIAQWRQTLAAALGERPDVLDELESHLREEIQRLLLAGHNAEQAFATAAARLGGPREIAAEFAKLPPTPVPWLPARLVLAAAIAWACLGTGLLLRTDREPLLIVHLVAVTLGYTGTLFVGLLSACYLFARPFADLAPGQRLSWNRAAVVLTATSAALTAAGVLLGGVWAREHLGRFWAWDARETAGLVITLWNVALLALLVSRHASITVRAVLGVVGSVVVLLGWFGVSWLLSRRHSYGYADGLETTFALVIACHAAVLALGLLPAGCLRLKRA